jgi:hypothetical protein
VLNFDEFRLWVATLCSSETDFHFGVIYRLNLQGREVSQARKQMASYAGFLLGFLYDPEDGSDNAFRNIGPSPNCTALESRRPFFLWPPLRDSQNERVKFDSVICLFD